MATSTLSAYFDTTVAANTKAWGSALATFLAANGFAQTADTGQIVWASFTSVPSGGSGPTYYGFQMWKFNDTIQSGGTPFFFKWEFQDYYTAGYGHYPQCFLTFGTGTDGAGNLTGTVSPRIQISTSQVSNTSVQQQTYFSGGTDNSGAGAWFSAAMWDGSSFQDPWIIAIERTKDNSGLPNTDGIIVHIVSSIGGCWSFVLPSAASGNIPLAPNNYFAAPLNLKQLSMAGSGIVGVSFPVAFNGRPYQQGISCALFQAGDFGPSTSNSFTVYGSSHTFRVPTTVTPATIYPTAANARIMLRYE